MQLAKRILAGAAFVAATVFAVPALAQEVAANTSVNVRNAPSGSIIDVMRAGERGTIVGRAGNWCDTQRHEGPDGWVYCTYLDRVGGGGGGGGGRADTRPDVNFSFSIPGFSFSVGDGDFRVRPGRPGRAAQVCFYEHVGFGGRSFCARPGERDARLGARWNDTISSIRVRGGAEVQVCENFNFRGRCVIIDRNVRNLGARGNDIISSYRVR